jgi:ferrochelatase
MVLTSAFSSYSGCRQYQDDVAAARAAVGPNAPLVSRTRHYFNTPGYVAAQADAVRAALGRLLGGGRGARLVFTAHSIPLSMAATAGPTGSGYVRQLRWSAGLVAARVADLTGEAPWDLVWQSRSGPPSVPWLEPDVGEHVHALHDDGVRQIVLVPIGFTSDHVEVVYDLDVHLRARLADLPGLELARAATVGTDPRFVRQLRDLVAERVARSADRPALGVPSHDVCPRGCCPAPVRTAAV